MRFGIAVLLALHGVAHLPGFLVAWQLAVLQRLPYHTSLFNGRVYVGTAGMRAVGSLWLLTSIAFVVAAAGAAFDRVWWLPFTISLVLVSCLLCAAEAPAARIGLLVNALLLLAVGVAPSDAARAIRGVP
jgi:hypothetical protein